MFTALNRPRIAYDEDFAAWSTEQALLLKARRFDDCDLENIIDEVEGLAGSERRALQSNLDVLLLHLLNWRYQAHKRKSGWNLSIIEHRYRVNDILTTSPSLRRHVSELLPGSYVIARAKAEKETGIDYDAFPEVCEFTLAQMLDLNFLPEAAPAT